jgi:hypothetical protein
MYHRINGGGFLEEFLAGGEERKKGEGGRAKKAQAESEVRTRKLAACASVDPCFDLAHIAVVSIKDSRPL